MYDELVKELREAEKRAKEICTNPYRFVPYYGKAARGGNMNGCEFCGYANHTAGKTLHIVEETEPRIFINMHGSGYIQIFDEDYPGFVDGFYVNYCPMCGARLRSGYVGGEPPKEE